MPLNEKLRSNLLTVYKELQDTGNLITPAKLTEYIQHFRSLFGPEVLVGLDGEPLLRKIHESSNRDSLVYWLEFKDDEEFPNIFGGIGGIIA